MYKFVAIDLDGTLLNNYGDLSLKTKEFFRNLNKEDIEIIPTSGRNLDSIKAFASEINSKNYIIGLNGGIIYDIQKDEIIYEKSMSTLKALNILKICDENSIFYSVYTDKNIVSNSLKYNVLYYYNKNLRTEVHKKTSLKIVENVYDYIKNMQDEKVVKIMIADETKSVFNSILKKISCVDDIEILDVSHSSRKTIRSGSQEFQLEYFYTEISEKGVDKWNAVTFLANKLNIKQDEIIAIGDNANDYNMIKNAGLGIAMKGCMPKLIDVADVITEYDNNNDGVALQLEKIFFSPST